MRHFLIFFPALFICYSLTGQIAIDYDPTIRGLENCVRHLKQVLESLPDSKRTIKSIRLQIDENLSLHQEAYRVKSSDETITVVASGFSGLRYGTLALAESVINLGDLSLIEETSVSPAFDVRAIKFNLPWEAYRGSRSMSYHLSVCRDLNFWEKYLDMMQENRFNTLALYNMHPFHFMVKLKDYPEASPFSNQEMKAWTDFWTALFRMAKDRGVDVYVVNWNIVIPDGLASANGIERLNDTSKLVRDYTRKSVTAVINTYPDLAGIGVTLADWMVDITPTEREDWIAGTFIRGIKEADREVKFLHRAVLSGSSDEMRRILNDADFKRPVDVEVKFNWSHGHSTPKLVITHASESGQINTGYWDPEPQNYKIQWMVRNEDFFILRWGEPDFIREHIATNNRDYVNGYHIGSEGYIPAADYFTRPENGRTWQYAFERQWLFYSLWGRLLFDPSTPDELFEKQFQKRYPFTDGKKMLDAYRLVSRMPLRLASFFKSTWDYTLYSEGFMAPVMREQYGLDDHHSQFISIDELIDHETLDPSLINVKTYVTDLLNKKRIDGDVTSPVRFAEMLKADAEEASRLLEFLEKNDNLYQSEYQQELDDIRAWGLLSNYFGDKLLAAVNLERYRQEGVKEYHSKAIDLLIECEKTWNDLSIITDRNYAEVPYFKSGTFGFKDENQDLFSWKKYLPEVKRDIQIAKDSKVGN